jgi:hypothetical protein
MRSGGFLLLALLALFAWDSQAGGKAVGNGGDELALELQNAALHAITQAAELGLISHDQLAPLRALTLEATVLTADNPLASFKDGVEQESIAINLPEQKTIVLNRFRWLDVSNARLREGIALHEVLSLAAIEGTGNYRVSGAYLSHFQLDLSDLRVPPKGEQRIVNCSDYNNTLFTVTGLKRGQQRLGITPIRESARAYLRTFLARLNVPFPENVASLSFELPQSACDYDPRNRGYIRCNKEILPRAGKLTLRYMNGAIDEIPLTNLRFRVASPFFSRVNEEKRLDILELGVATRALEPDAISTAMDAQLTLNIRSRTCR